ncbi:hypothetical protein M378DRAFT_185152 [Amanita muscaria Koide BX008]|uniref:Protein EFR3 n=1 Tax=Amanita muscaria (strain Koide BX008) TaxID=946122 RepID=A0A0C2X1V1_AMAMK|nr:hypothetical protein M378DRAFT_185152 [Amanita muscaria Koide BX008]
MRIFTPNHLQLLNACYPPSSILMAAGSNYSPNSHELSRLTYYASNHPGKLNKISSELDKRIKTEVKKAKAGYSRSRASLLVSLAILRALTVECRSDLQLFCGALMSSVDATLSNVPADLEVIARAASVFIAWATYTDGHLIGIDANFTQDYLTVLGHFAALSCYDVKDHEMQNRTRLIGIAAMNGAVNSEALHYNPSHFGKQVSIMMKPSLSVILHAPVNRLEEQAADVKESPISPYFAEFRARPAAERRAASIHVHIDGDTGPSDTDVIKAFLRVLFVLISHANGVQLGQITQSSFDVLDALQAWPKVEHCCWLSKRIADWAQYQYRYVVPTWLVERLSQNQDVPATSPLPKTLLSMINAVLDASIPLVDLSSSDLLSSLVTLMLRRISKDSKDELVPTIVNCISSLGRHVYYSDQIQDLASEMVNRLTIVEIQGISGNHRRHDACGRIEAIRSLLAALRGLIHTANQDQNYDRPLRAYSPGSDGIVAKTDDSRFRRTRVPPDIWHDTLSLLCDKDYAVRADYADLLVFYLKEEMPRRGDISSSEPMKQSKTLESPRLPQAAPMNAVLHGGDVVMRVISAIHAYLYILSVACSLGFDSSPESTPSSSSTMPDLINVATTAQSGRQAPRLRKVSNVQKLAERIPQVVSSSSSACLADYTHILRILSVVHEQTPIRSLFVGIPMLLALDASTRIENAGDSLTAQRIFMIRELVARVWLAVGKVWKSDELVRSVEEALSTMPRATMILNIQNDEAFQAPREPVQFSDHANLSEYQWVGVNAETAVRAIANCRSVQDATGLQTDALISRFTVRWIVDDILKDSFEKTPDFEASIRGDGLSPLLKITPALMQDNMSLHSLARSARAVGVTDLREALEGRSSMSNPALACAASFSTLEHTSSHNGDRGQGGPMSRTKQHPSVGTREVRDVLNRLGIGKQNANLLKASFPAFQKSVQK